MNELIEIAQLLLDYSAQNAANLNPESQQFLAQLMETVFALIEGDSGVEGLSPQGAEPLEPSNMTPGGFPSSNINGFKYDPQSKQLLVQYHGPYPQAAGPIYRYTNVPQNTFDVVSRGQVGPRTSGQNRYHKWQRNISPSLGASVNALIKEGGYKYQRVS